MNKDIQEYNAYQVLDDRVICDLLSQVICDELPGADNMIWHGHPVWFIEGNPIVGYSKMKNRVQLLFWSGQSFDEELLGHVGRQMAAGIDFTTVDQIMIEDVRRWLSKSKIIQWDYKNITKRKGLLERLK